MTVLLHFLFPLCFFIFVPRHVLVIKKFYQCTFVPFYLRLLLNLFKVEFTGNIASS